MAHHPRKSSATLPRSSQGPQDTRVLPNNHRAEDLQTQNVDGFSFVSCVERNPIGELWHARDASGKEYLAQMLPTEEDIGRASRFLAAIKQPGLPPNSVIERDGQPIFLTELRHQTLRDRFQECWSQGLPGVPRAELIGYLQSAATAIDQLREKFQIYHLGLRPRNLLLAGTSAEVSGYGLVDLLGRATSNWAAFAGPAYAAPELLQNRPSAYSDQYSLALIFAEILTGLHPLRSKQRRSKKAPTEADLSLLRQDDRRIIARALAPSPNRRFSSSSEMVGALVDVGRPAEVEHREPMSSLIAFPPLPHYVEPLSSLDIFVSELVLMATQSHQIKYFNKIRYRLEPGRQIEHHCAIRNFQSASVLKLEGFRAHWQAQRLHQDDGCIAFSIHLPSSFWQRLVGRRMGLEIQVQVVPTPFPSTKRSEVAVLIRPFGCSRNQAVKILEDWGPQVLESVRCYLQAHPEQRATERIPYKQPLRVSAVFGGTELAAPIECISKDISSEGIGFFLPDMALTPEIYINVPDVPQLAAFAGLAKIVRRQPCGEGWSEIGARFALGKNRPSRPN